MEQTVDTKVVERQTCVFNAVHMIYLYLGAILETCIIMLSDT